MRWHCPRRADYLLQLWPDGAVVYDEASGDIHALSPIAGELLQQLFGERGRHARAAVGSVALPLGATVEVELLAEVSG